MDYVGLLPERINNTRISGFVAVVSISEIRSSENKQRHQLKAAFHDLAYMASHLARVTEAVTIPVCDIWCRSDKRKPCKIPSQICQRWVEMQRYPDTHRGSSEVAV